MKKSILIAFLTIALTVISAYSFYLQKKNSELKRDLEYISKQAMFEKQRAEDRLEEYIKARNEIKAFKKIASKEGNKN